MKNDFIGGATVLLRFNKTTMWLLCLWGQRGRADPDLLLFRKIEKLVPALSDSVFIVINVEDEWSELLLPPILHQGSKI